MPDREKVIKGLEFTKAMITFNPSTGEDIEPGNLNEADKTTYDACVGAIALLKEQEPRVVTLAELWHMEHKPVYLQRKNSRLYMAEPAIVLTTERCYIPSLGDSYIFMRENKIHDKYWAYKYNVTWRCWTHKPTDEQREAVKWDD